MNIVKQEFLPTLTRSVHAATVEIWNDHPVFAWFGGSREGGEDVAIYLHNLNGKDETMSIGNRDGYPRWNPILFSHNDSLYMFEKIGIFCDRWQTFVHDVTDWTTDTPEKEIRATAQTIPAGLNGPVKTRPVVVKEGDECEDGEVVVCGSSVETFFDWTSYFEYYKVSNGEWKFLRRSKPLEVKQKVSYRNPFNGRTQNSLGIIQPAMWVVQNKVHSFFRSSGGLDSIYFYEENSYLTDPVETNLKNPNSGVDVAQIGNRLFLVHNPDDKYRFPLVVSEIERWSDDTFTVVDEITIREKVNSEETCNSQELSYPYMIAHNNQLHLAYTYGRSKIEYVVIDV